MRINGPLPVQPQRAVRRTAAAPTAQFAALIGGAGESAAPMPALLVGNLLAVDADTDAAQGRSRGIERATDMLQDLDGLRRDLLAGGISRGRLDRLAAGLALARPAADAGLAAVLDAIELRVAVELAKHDPQRL